MYESNTWMGSLKGYLFENMNTYLVSDQKFGAEIPFFFARVRVNMESWLDKRMKNCSQKQETGELPKKKKQKMIFLCSPFNHSKRNSTLLKPTTLLLLTKNDSSYIWGIALRGIDEFYYD